MADGRIDTDALLSRIRTSDVVMRRTKLRKAGRSMVGLCPFHSEKTPSFHVYPADGGYFCYGCGAGGSAIDFVMRTEGLPFRAACEALANGDLPTVSPEELVKAREEEKAIKREAIQLSLDVWNRAVPLAGTPAAAYLRSREIAIEPARMRYAQTPAWYDAETGETGPDLPALVCAVSNADDIITGIQRVFIQPDGSGKNTSLKNAKLSLGRPAGGAIRLGPAQGDHVIVVEGPEDGATVSQMREDQPVFVACGTAMMPQIAFPPAIRRVTIGGDNNKAGRAAAHAAKAAYQDRGLEVRAVYPEPQYGDWNDQLRGIRKDK